MPDTFSDLISIIIVNFNGRKHLETCLKHLSNINYKNYEILIIDNHSTDGTLEFLQKNHPSIKVIKLEKNLGFAEPCNIGVKNSNGKYILFLNNDTQVTPNFLGELINTIQSDSSIGICQSLLLKPDDTIDSSGDFINKVGIPFSLKNKPDGIKDILSAKGASLLIRKKVFNSLEGFDAKFFASFEDVDLGWRTWILGYQIKLVPNSIVYHTGGETVKNIRNEIKFHSVKNLMVMTFTNFETPMIKNISNLFKYFLFRKHLTNKTISNNIEIPSLLIILKSLIWIFKNYSYIKQKRDFVNSNRTNSSKILFDKGLIFENSPKSVPRI